MTAGFAAPFVVVPMARAAPPSAEVQTSGTVSMDGPQGHAGPEATPETPETEATTPPPERRRIEVSGFDDAQRSKPWMKRYAPERHMVEFGVFGGLWLPSRNHELFAPDESLPEQGYRDLRAVNADVGGRIGYFPRRFFGVELETAMLPSRTDPDGVAALGYAVRGHVVGQLGWWRITPFVVAGLSALGVTSARTALGDDDDFAVHLGAGAKFYLNRYFGARLDLRDSVAAKRGVEKGITNNGEVLLSLTFTLGRDEPRPLPPPDRDRDGFLDHEDRCPDVPGVSPDGCPIPDRDGDGFLDPDDDCPQTPGVQPRGCPATDTDGDGFMDAVDACPQDPGVAPDGCPIRDTDGDGITDPDDRCVDDPETRNGFQDADGCPDELPEQVKAFNGVIEGIFFDTAKDTIKPASRPRLDEAAKTLAAYPELRIEISGHTDSRGDEAYNLDLSRRRAESVKQYLVDAGIDAARITTRGAGPGEPIDTNNTAGGRAKNRRIEFRVLDD